MSAGAGRRLTRMLGWLDGRPRAVVLLAAFLVLLLAAVDHVTGVEISFSIFYMVPVALAAWCVGTRTGLAFAAAGCIAWFVNDSVLGDHAYSHAAIPYWNALMRGMMFSVLAVLTARVRRSLASERSAFGQLELAFDELDRARREQMALKDRLLSHVSHELRTPLTALHQFLTLLRDGLVGELTAPQSEAVGVALRNADQLKAMIGDLLESSRADSGKLAVSLAEMDLRPLLADLVRIFRSPASERGVEIALEIDGELPLVNADATRMRQVLVNLMDNALKFTPGPGTVTMAARPDPDLRGRVRVSVADTGRGIAAAALPRIFSRLYQEEATSDAGRRGLGLGLHICREIVGRHGGTIWAESEIGRGTTVSFTLPVAGAASAASAASGPATEADAPRGD